MLQMLTTSLAQWWYLVDQTKSPWPTSHAIRLWLV
jgi:hypothetical protein